MFVVVVRFQSKPDRAAEFRELLLAQARNSLQREVACRRFDVALDPSDPTSLLLYELYDDRAAFDAHLESDHFRQFDAGSADLVASKEVSLWGLAE